MYICIAIYMCVYMYLSLSLSPYIYIYIYIYISEIGGNNQLTPIGKSVSVSFRVRVVRACVRVKLWRCGSEVCSQRWRLELQEVLHRRWIFRRAVYCYTHWC